MTATSPLLRVGTLVVVQTGVHRGRIGRIAQLQGPLLLVEGVAPTLRHAGHWYFPVDVRLATEEEQGRVRMSP